MMTTTTRRRLSWRDDTTDGLAIPIGINDDDDDDDDGRGGKTMTKSSFGDAGRVALGEIDSNARLPSSSSSEDEERRMRSKAGSTTTTTTTTYMAGSTPGALSAKHASRLATLRAEEDEEDEEEEESSVLLADDEFSFEFTGNVVDDVVTPGGSEDDSGTSDTLVLTSKASRLSRVHETLEVFKSLATLAISPPSSSEATRAAPTPANTPAASNANVLLRRFEATETTTTTTMDASSPVVVRDASMTSARLMSPRHGLIGKIIASMSLSDAVEIGDDEMAAISTAPRLAAFVILMTVAALMFCSAACATTAVAYAIKSPLRAMMMTTKPAAKPPRVLVEGAAFAYRWWYRSGENATRFVLFFKLEDTFASYGAFFARRARESVQVEMAKRAERTIALLRSMSVAFGYCAAFLAFIAAATQVVANMTAATTTGAAMKANDDGDVDVDDDDDISNGSTPMIVERAYLAARTFVLEPSAKTPPSLASSTQSQSSNSATPSRLIHV